MKNLVVLGPTPADAIDCEVRHELIGLVIGRRGKTISRIRKRTGAHIILGVRALAVGDALVENSAEEYAIVRICGDEEARTGAQAMVAEALESATAKSSVTNADG